MKFFRSPYELLLMRTPTGGNILQVSMDMLCPDLRGADETCQVRRPMRTHPETMVSPKEKRILWIMTASLWKTLSCDVFRRSVFSPCETRNGVSAPQNSECIALTIVAALVKVDDLKPVQFREKAFRRLVIRDDYKRIIKAMVEAYRLEKPGFNDIVSGKGRGLTILLHGPPGTGKTLTAGQFENNLPLASQMADDPTDQQQNAWLKNRNAHFLLSVAETWVLSQKNWRSS